MENNIPKLEDIVLAQSLVYDVARVTDIDHLERLSSRLGYAIFVKREDQQSIRSFKNRGSYVKIKQLSADEKSRGVITASAGNHAQGVAQGAALLGIQSLIVMPRPTATIKIEMVQRLGGEVILYGDTYDDAYAYAKTLEEQEKMTFIHPFNDPAVIAGQGTIGLEIIKQNGSFEYIFVPVGGGGLISGIAVALKSTYPHTKIIGVESSTSDCMKQSVEQGKAITLDTVGRFAEGIAVKTPGTLTYALCRQYVDSWITVTDDEICAAIKDVYDDIRIVPETAGAASIAGAKQFVRQDGLKKDAKLCCIISGANLDFIRLKEIAERAEIGEKEEYFFMVEFPERAGALHDYLAHVVGDHNISLFRYRKKGGETASVLVGIEMQGRISYDSFLEAMQKSKFNFRDVTHDELVKQFLT